jgi:hypothetical protein
VRGLRNERWWNLKVYRLGNIDGDNAAIVAAPNQREAVRLMGTTLGQYRAYGGHVTENPVAVSLAMSKPGTVFYKALSWPSEWSEKRHRRTRDAL